MNFAFLASLAWLFTTPEKIAETGLFPKEKLVNGGIYILQNEADASVCKRATTPVLYKLN